MLVYCTRLSLLYTKVLEGGRLISNLDELSRDPSLAADPSTAERFSQMIRSDVDSMGQMVKEEIRKEEEEINKQVGGKQHITTAQFFVFEPFISQAF